MSLAGVTLAFNVACRWHKDHSTFSSVFSLFFRYLEYSPEYTAARDNTIANALPLAKAELEVSTVAV